MKIISNVHPTCPPWDLPRPAPDSKHLPATSHCSSSVHTESLSTNTFISEHKRTCVIYSGFRCASQSSLLIISQLRLD